MCAQWERWDGTPVREPPLFYTGLSELAADILSTASDEVLQLSKAVNEKSGVDTSQVILWTFFRVCLNFNSRCFFENWNETFAKLYGLIRFSEERLAHGTP